jgi:hypothetical protein
MEQTSQQIETTVEQRLVNARAAARLEELIVAAQLKLVQDTKPLKLMGTTILLAGSFGVTLGATTLITKLIVKRLGL